MISKSLVLIALCFACTTNYCQEIKGKWMRAYQEDAYTSPKNLIIEIQEDSIKYYSFDSFLVAYPAKLKKNKIIIDKNATAIINFMNEDRIQISNSNESGVKNKLSNSEFVRLLPTDATLSPEKIRNFSYLIERNNDQIPVAFKDSALKTKLVDQSSNITAKDNFRLEILDETYFISSYYQENRMETIPIKKITKHYMIVYGFGEKPYEVKANRIP